MVNSISNLFFVCLKTNSNVAEFDIFIAAPHNTMQLHSDSLGCPLWFYGGCFPLIDLLELSSHIAHCNTDQYIKQNAIINPYSL